jgi:hypothetical protein
MTIAQEQLTTWEKIKKNKKKFLRKKKHFFQKKNASTVKSC